MKQLWVEQYRPNTVDGYVFVDDAQREQVETWIREGSIPHLMLSGSAGTGKTTLAKLLINQLEVDQNETQRVLLYSRIKYGVAVVLGLLLAYFAYRFLTADEMPKEITGQNATQGSYEMNSPK